MIISDANSAVSSVAYRTNEVIAIYPITPSSTMAEKVSKWATLNKKNIFGDIPKTIEMQSEAGAIATVHGALQTGALSTTFTSSQGLLLMIPTLYKLAGQLMPFVLHVATRTVATHALSIFSDHSDVMAVRQTGCAMLSASSVQEAQDFALISQIASLKSSLPFIHFFDGFRTSHEINTIEPLDNKTIKRLIPHHAIETFRSRALTPDNPVIRGTAANPDTYFQCREAINVYYDNAYQHIVEAMNNFASETGRQYTPYEYYGADNAIHIIILMGSAAGTVKEVIDVLLARGKKVGVLIVHLFRPFSARHLLNTIPESVNKIAVLDRTLDKQNIVQLLQDIIEKSYGSKGQDVVTYNWQALNMAIDSLEEVPLQTLDLTSLTRPSIVPENAPDFVKTVTATMLAGLGDNLPVSAFPPDGTWPVGTTKWEKRNIADEIPIWQKDLCTQCNHCVVACPHSAIRAKVINTEEMINAPETLPSLEVKARDMKGQRYVLQVAPEDCTGCQLCVEVCPARDRDNLDIKAINMRSRIDNLQVQKNNFNHFMKLPDRNKNTIDRIDIRTSQLLTPLFEYSGACAGCGETPYIKLLTQLFGDRIAIANATGCSSIYGGNLPTTPYTKNSEGRGPAWANSLFEDNAEFALGFRLTYNHHKKRAMRLLDSLATYLPSELVNGLKDINKSIDKKRQLIDLLRNQLRIIKSVHAKELIISADYLIDKSVWAIGGDGWAYDIGFGGLDHILSLNENINILVLDTQGYANTGGQQSKATPMGAVAKFAELGKNKMCKDLGGSMMMYGHVYVAQIALGAQLNQTVKAIQEAEEYNGPSLIIAYSPCEEHGYDLAYSFNQTKNLVKSGFWTLYRYDPRRTNEGKAALQLDSRPPAFDDLNKTIQKEQRFRRLHTLAPEIESALYRDSKRAIMAKYHFMEMLSKYTSNKR